METIEEVRRGRPKKYETQQEANKVRNNFVIQYYKDNPDIKQATNKRYYLKKKAKILAEKEQSQKEESQKELNE